MSAMQSYTEAFEIFKRDPVDWIVLTIVVAVAGSFIPVLGAFMLLPNILRESRAALLEGRGPKLAGVFDFGELPSDVGSMLLYALSQTVGMLFCCVGQLFAWILFWYSAELSADGRVSVTDTMRASLLWVKANPGDTLAMALIGCLLNSIGASFVIGVFITAPITYAAWAVHWQAIRQDVYALAESNGITVAAEPTPHTHPPLTP